MAGVESVDLRMSERDGNWFVFEINRYGAHDDRAITTASARDRLGR
jgi:hypothetical protein